MAEKLRRCPLCGHSPLRPAFVDRTIEYGSEEDERIAVQVPQVPIEVCDGCGESYSGPDAARAEHNAICRTLGLPMPSEIVALRQHLGLSQAELAELTGIGKATISRWERGRMLTSRGMARYLGLLHRNPTNAALLKAFAAAPISPLAELVEPPPTTPKPEKACGFELIVGMDHVTNEIREGESDIDAPAGQNAVRGPCEGRDH
jgi:putative zinc finger/helix-turn-helix YgiT family protein